MTLRGQRFCRDFEITGLLLILVVAASFYAVFILRTSFAVTGEAYLTLIDDAMISMRYAKNLASGYGLVWNPGEAPVEGFTNLGWTLFMACFHLLPISSVKIPPFIMLASLFVLLINSILIFKLVRILDPTSQRAPFIAAAIVAFYYPLVYWTLRGMEVGILTLFIHLSL